MTAIFQNGFHEMGYFSCLSFSGSVNYQDFHNCQFYTIILAVKSDTDEDHQAFCCFLSAPGAGVTAKIRLPLENQGQLQFKRKNPRMDQLSTKRYNKDNLTTMPHF